jgi:hypothetical protein
MWQWNIQPPGLSATKATSTFSRAATLSGALSAKPPLQSEDEPTLPVEFRRPSFAPGYVKASAPDNVGLVDT